MCNVLFCDCFVIKLLYIYFIFHFGGVQFSERFLLWWR